MGAQDSKGQKRIVRLVKLVQGLRFLAQGLQDTPKTLLPYTARRDIELAGSELYSPESNKVLIELV